MYNIDGWTKKDRALFEAMVKKVLTNEEINEINVQLWIEADKEQEEYYRAVEEQFEKAMNIARKYTGGEDAV